jgi:SET domain-containing protein
MKREDFVIRRTATGLGLFTLRAIKKGQRIIEYVGTIITNEEADRRGGKYLFELDEKRAVDGHARSNTARYINHSCRPNAEGLTTGSRIWIWAMRDIKAGEELTLNYGKEYLDMHIKRCMCEKCVTERKKKRSSKKSSSKAKRAKAARA